jgi:hypothetical protein
LENKDSTKLTSSISEKALRYDLTVPFAGTWCSQKNDIEFPLRDTNPTCLACRQAAKNVSGVFNVMPMW